MNFDDSPSPRDNTKPSSPKRKGDVNANGRPVKRRASKACASCRTRKVRCNVVEHGAPCTNCRLDDVQCLVTESKRRKKHVLTNSPLNTIGESPDSHQHHHHEPHVPRLSDAEARAAGSVNPNDITNPKYRQFRQGSGSSSSNNGDGPEHVMAGQHVPHPLYQRTNRLNSGIINATTASLLRRNSAADGRDPVLLEKLVSTVSMHGDLTAHRTQMPTPPPAGIQLPAYLKPLPSRLMREDVQYLHVKGALTIPEKEFRNELIRSYIEWVYPFMPLIDLFEFLTIMNDPTGESGRISLILFQAIMFTGTAFVDMAHLKAAGYKSRKEARKAFYMRARLLYDFDYEIDRIALTQALLLMTYWYETPDDQKDTWHWMGVAISMAHTIGLHRNPNNSSMDPRRKKLWKRIWWSTFMRDRLVALGMRRPMRIQDSDCDVPMLEMDDFEFGILPEDNTIVPANCTLVRNIGMQRDLAEMCIQKAKLSLCISHVLSAQYSVLVSNQGAAQGSETNTRSNTMLVPKKEDLTDEVDRCDGELRDWVNNIPYVCQYDEGPSAASIANGHATVDVQRCLLNMVYWATISALHRPQVTPSGDIAVSEAGAQRISYSRGKVRDASREITRIATDLYNLGLDRYLPTSGVTVLLPAIIIHLLDMRTPSGAGYESASVGFRTCMIVLDRLRENYAAADFATQFLQAAINKANDQLAKSGTIHRVRLMGAGDKVAATAQSHNGVKNTASSPLNNGPSSITPPPDQGNGDNEKYNDISLLSSYNQITTPDSDGQDSYESSTRPDITSNFLDLSPSVRIDQNAFAQTLSNANHGFTTTFNSLGQPFAHNFVLQSLTAAQEHNFEKDFGSFVNMGNLLEDGNDWSATMGEGGGVGESADYLLGDGDWMKDAGIGMNHLGPIDGMDGVENGDANDHSNHNMEDADGMAAFLNLHADSQVQIQA